MGREDDCKGKFLCVNEKYTTSAKGVTSDFVKVTELKYYVCGNNSACDQNASLHHIPKQVEKRTVWLKVLKWILNLILMSVLDIFLRAIPANHLELEFGEKICITNEEK